jgi:predicted ATPase/DNA-binding CsgD family transcriptional regulator
MAITRARGKLGGSDAPADSGRAPGAVVLLPQPLSSFVGRERELKELEELIAKVRLLTLTGPGGSGKTRLAIEIARLTSERLPTDTAFVDLASISDPGLVVSTVATALGIRPKAGRSLMEALVEHLAARPVVLVLDNLEQLLPDAATTIAELLGSCPDLRVLATSRAPLHIRGEHQYAVDSLVQAEALLLFVERARSVVSHFALTEDNTAAMIEVCRHLDGLPLAIELAAACSKVMSPQALLHRLEQRVPVPASAAVDAPARQRTLRDTMAWSYGLLHRSDQRVFARLSVFVGGFSGPAVEDIVPDPNDEAPIDVMASIQHLVDHNLVRAVPDAQGEARFNLLETIRAFAIDQVSPPEAQRLRERHAMYFVQEASRQGDYGVASTWPGRVENDLDNFRTAWSWAAANGNAEVILKLATAMWAVFAPIGHGEEAGQWLHTAEQATESAEPGLRGPLLLHLAQHELAFGGDRRRAEDLLTQALRLAENAKDARGRTLILVLLSHVASDLGDRKRATQRMRQAIGHAQSLNDPLERARILGLIASSGHFVLDRAEAMTLAKEVTRFGRESDDHVSLTAGLTALGYVAMAEGRASTGVRALSEAASILEARGLDPDGLTGMLGVAQLRVGDFVTSRSMLIHALRRGRELGVVWLCLTALEGTADWLGAARESQRASVYWAAVDAIRSVTRDRTPGDDLGIFKASRSRDRSALTLSAQEAASADGRSMRLDEALASAMRDLGQKNIDLAKIAAGDSGSHDLTPREHEVLRLLATGRSDGQIAEELFISKKTAAVHVGNIKGKLGASSRVEIVTIALRTGLVDAGP